MPEMQLHADWAVTMGCGDACPYVPTTVDAWEIPDPAGLPVEAVRPIRDVIERHVHELIEDKLEAIRTDETATATGSCECSLAREEFEDSRTAQEIRACADAVLARFDDVPVRSHIMAIALREARACLRAEHCAALDAAVR